MANLLATKLYLPSIPPKRVGRPHLIQRLNEGLEAGRQITLVSAPAGFGKTTCISEWVNGVGLPVTWLSLDPSDDDPGQFFTYLTAALQKVDKNLGWELEGLLNAGQLPPSEIITTTLINDILELQGRFLLVLDDFQVIQDLFILQVFEKLVTHLLQPGLPQPLHLVLLTREDPSLPLARLRAKNQVTEIRAGDLRFSLPEAGRFLNEEMGLSLSDTEIATLEERTEGWIVGLQLAAIAMQSPSPSHDWEKSSNFIEALSGSRRFILSYLTEEVLSRQPEEIQHFLLQTSILDRLNGDLCNAVTGRTDSHLLLEQLYDDNLFLIPLDDDLHWFRYHHLFADLLRDLQKIRLEDQAAEYHRRASRWYAQAGMVDDAIQHALASGDYDAAVQLLENHALDMLMEWRVKMVEGWLQAIPQEWSSQSPRTNLAFAWMHFMRRDFPGASPNLERLKEMFSTTQVYKEEDAALTAGWLALQSSLLNAQGKPSESLALANQALEIVPEKDIYVQSQIYMGLASAYEQMDEYARAVEAYQKIIRLGRAAKNIFSEMLGVAGLARMALFRGQLNFAYDLTSKGIDRMERSGSMPPISTALYGELGQVYYHWHQLEQAHSHFLRAVQVSVLSGYSDAELYYKVIRSRLFQVEGDLEAASREIQKAVELMQVEAPGVVHEEVFSQQVRIDLALDRLAAAETVLTEAGFSHQGKFAIPDLPLDQPITYPLGRLYNSALRILLYRARAKGELAGLNSGIGLADRLVTGALQKHLIPLVLETLLLRGQMHAALENDRASSAASLADIAKALELAEPEGFISTFVEEGPPVAGILARLLKYNRLETVRSDYVEKILAAFSRYRPLDPSQVEREAHHLPSASGGSVALIERLTDRELDVMRLMAEGLKYEEIAQRLFVSLNTVRSHVKTVYGKLGVNNRTKAIEKARQLQII